MASRKSRCIRLCICKVIANNYGKPLKEEIRRNFNQLSCCHLVCHTLVALLVKKYADISAFQHLIAVHSDADAFRQSLIMMVILM